MFRHLTSAAVDHTGTPWHVHRSYHFVHSRQKDIHLQAGAVSHSFALAFFLRDHETAGYERGRRPALRLGCLEENARKHVRHSSFYLCRRMADIRLPAMPFFSVPLNLSKNSAARLPPSPPLLSLHATPTPAATKSLPLAPLRAPRLLREQPG